MNTKELMIYPWDALALLRQPIDLAELLETTRVQLEKFEEASVSLEGETLVVCWAPDSWCIRVRQVGGPALQLLAQDLVAKHGEPLEAPEKTAQALCGLEVVADPDLDLDHFNDLLFTLHAIDDGFPDCEVFDGPTESFMFAG